MTTDIHIVGARRTAIGRLNGALSTLPAHDLGSRAIAAALEAAGIAPDAVEETIIGQVLTAGAGMNPARQAARGAGIPDASPAFLVNQVCGSGLRAVALGRQQILCRDADVIIAGGQESMSRSPHVAMLRTGRKLGDVTFTDSMMRDGLTDAFYGYPMGVTAENVVRRYGISRDEQDRFALESHRKASAATASGRFADEIVAVTIPTRTGDMLVAEDEPVRHDATLAAIAKPNPAFEADGTVTAANASGISDGAAALVLMSDAALRRHGAASMARIVSWATTGLDPQMMGLGPIAASHKALASAGWSVDSVDLWEINEAFAAQSLAVIRDLHPDPDRVNVNGGAIALGHPIGASGARVLVSLVHELARRGVQRGLATLCIGGGMGIAMCIERQE